MTIALPYSKRKILLRWLIILFLTSVIWWRAGWPILIDMSLLEISSNVSLMITVILFLLVSIAYLLKAVVRKPPVIINDDGIKDERLKIGMLPWDQIQSVLSYNEYGALLLLLKLKRPLKQIRMKSFTHQIVTKFYRLGNLADIYIDLTELNIQLDEIMQIVNRKIQSKTVAE